MQSNKSTQLISFKLMKIVPYTDNKKIQLEKEVDALFSKDTDFEWFSTESKNPLKCFKLLILPSKQSLKQLQKQQYEGIVLKELSSDYCKSITCDRSKEIDLARASYTFQTQQIRFVSHEKLMKECQRRRAVLLKQSNQSKFLLIWRLIKMNRKNNQMQWNADKDQNCKYYYKHIGIVFIQEKISDVSNFETPNHSNTTNNCKGSKSSPLTANSSKQQNIPVLTIYTKSSVLKSNLQDLGLFGLPNNGNTCFMNSALQCLFQTHDLTRSILEMHSNRKQKPLLFAYSELVRTMLKERVDSIKMTQLKYVIETKNSSFRGFTQNDSQMFLLTMLDTLMDELKLDPNAQYEMVKENKQISESDRSEQFWQKEKNYSDSFVSELFRGQLRCRIFCKDCSQVLQSTFDPFLIVQLQVEAPMQRHIENRPNVGKINQIIQINLYYVQNQWSSQVVSYTGRGPEESSLGQAVSKLAEYKGLCIAPIVMIYGQENTFEECTDIRLLTIKEVSQHKSRVYVYKQILSSSKYQIPTFVQYKFKGKLLSEGRYFNLDQIGKYSSFGKIEYHLQKVTKQSFKEAFDHYQLLEDKTLNGFRRMLIYLKKEVQFKVPERKSTTVFQIANIDNRTTTNQRPFLKSYWSPPPPCNLMDCLETFSALTVLSSLPSNFCKSCKKEQPTSMRIDLYRTGRILIFALGRFDLNTGFKSERKVDFPFHLDLTGRESQKIHHTAQTPTATYRLYAVINHYGSFQCGHYAAVCCVRGKWYSYDDDYVSEVEQWHVVTQNAYVLFYERDD